MRLVEELFLPTSYSGEARRGMDGVVPLNASKHLAEDLINTPPILPIAKHGEE